MNKFYKVVRCQSTGVFKAVSELGKSQGKGKGLGKKIIATSLVAALGTMGAHAAAGNVVGGTDNTAVGENATVGGGFGNTAGGLGATVAGGSGNYAEGDYGAVGGGVVQLRVRKGVYRFRWH